MSLQTDSDQRKMRAYIPVTEARQIIDVYKKVVPSFSNRKTALPFKTTGELHVVFVNKKSWICISQIAMRCHTYACMGYAPCYGCCMLDTELSFLTIYRLVKSTVERRIRSVRIRCILWGKCMISFRTIYPYIVKYSSNTLRVVATEHFVLLSSNYCVVLYETLPVF
jgi:hypothetical protein